MTIHRLVCSLALTAAVILAVPAGGHAQGVQTGVLSGVVRDPQDLPLPGATVTATSPAMQGERTVVTDAIGAYIIRGLPPGTYTVRFQFTGTGDVQETVVVPLGGLAELNATLQLSGVQEVVNVVADSTPPPLVTTQVSTNFSDDTINVLPVGRRPFEIAELAPGVTDNTPNVGQASIGGAFGFDTLYLIDGVDTNDNLFGTSNALFIEDAIEETQVLTSGISAEYGRFGGGVINVITKSGGNDFSGSFRTNLSKPAWTAETPFERERNQSRSETLAKFFEGTIGGPVVRNRLWFFNADRYQDSETGRAFAEVGGAYATGTNNKRFEVKLTGTPVVNHTVSGSYLSNQTSSTDLPSINDQMSMTPSTLVSSRNPNSLWVVNYNGVLTNKLFGTFQWSKKAQGFRDNGGTSTVLEDSPFITRGNTGVPVNRHYNAPYFSSNDPEDRNNEQWAGSVSYYVTNSAAGRHDLKAGFEHFKSFRNGGNSQSATGYVFRTDYLPGSNGQPLIVDGEPVPVWRGNAAVPGSALTRIENWLSVPGATIDIKTLSLYVQDRWTAGDRLTLDLGLRYEKVRSDATGGIVGADTDTLLPRVGMSWDVQGNGVTIAQASYARYSGRFTERFFGRNTNVGTPSRVDMAYIGPDGQGMNFAPAFNLANYAIIGGNFPTANVFFDEGLTSPKTNEFTLSLGRELPATGYVKAVYSFRSSGDFIEDVIADPSANGKVTVEQGGRVYGIVDKVLWQNTDVQKRQYQALQFMSRVRVIDTMNVEGHWTIQLQNHGNFEGEQANQPGNGSIWLDYPELFNEARYYPYGPLDEFQRHKVRIWTTYVQSLGRFGSMDISPLWRINSGLTYSLFTNNVALSAAQIARNPGYQRSATTGTAATLFYGERGSENFAGYGVLDLAITYGIPVWKSLRPWLQLQTYNVFNNQKLIQWDTTVTPDPNSPLDELGQRTGYVRGQNFGTATATSHFPRWSTGETGGRTFRVALGVRF